MFTQVRIHGTGIGRLALRSGAAAIAIVALAGCGSGSAASKSTAPSTSLEPLPTETATAPAGTATAKPVDAPSAKLKDCWKAGGATGTYEKTSCTKSHAYEVYVARPLYFKDYQSAKHPAAGETADAWVDRMSTALCQSKYSPKILAAGVKDADVSISSVFSTGLAEKADSSWKDAQIVCLVMRADEKPVTARLLK